MSPPRGFPPSPPRPPPAVVMRRIKGAPSRYLLPLRLAFPRGPFGNLFPTCVRYRCPICLGAFLFLAPFCRPHPKPFFDLHPFLRGLVSSLSLCFLDGVLTPLAGPRYLTPSPCMPREQECRFLPRLPRTFFLFGTGFITNGLVAS